MKRKTFIKKLMALGFSRNGAGVFAHCASDYFATLDGMKKLPDVRPEVIQLSEAGAKIHLKHY